MMDNDNWINELAGSGLAGSKKQRARSAGG